MRSAAVVALLVAILAPTEPTAAREQIRYRPLVVMKVDLPVPLVPVVLMDKWSKVAWCETHGNWSFNGSRYDGGLGIMPGNWLKYGGAKYAPLPHLATPEQQVLVAMEINKGYEIPDQQGECKSW